MPLYMDHHYIEGVLWDDIKFALEKTWSYRVISMQRCSHTGSMKGVGQ